MHLTEDSRQACVGDISTLGQKERADRTAADSDELRIRVKLSLELPEECQGVLLKRYLVDLFQCTFSFLFRVNVAE